MTAEDAAFHESMKPSFCNNGIFVYSVDGSTPQVSEPLIPGLESIVGEHKEVRFAKWMPAADINTQTLSGQKEMTTVDLVSGFPRANTSAAASFVDYAGISTDEREQAIWNLAGHLFDPIERLVEASEMTTEQVKYFEPRLRKDAFSTLWSSLVQSGLDEQLGLVRTAEEQALLYLTKNDIPAACDALAAGKDFKLATLIAQLPGSEDSRLLMKNQIAAWLDRNDWAEFSDATRALYSILAGDVCTVIGKNAPAENRAKEFCIAERFGLSWLQSFGLRVFFGGHDMLGDVVKAYCDALADGKERVLPSPSWMIDEDAADREDVLMGLLRLSLPRAAAFDPSSVFDPKTVSGSAVNSRLAWQLATQLRAKGLCSALADDKLDQLTFSFAMELEAAGKFMTATWVLLHLRHADTRTRAVNALLNRNGGHIPEAGATPEGTVDAFHVLNTENLIPGELLWSAKALHARAELDNAWLQCEYLLQAGALDEAHEVVCETLGPKAIIEEDYEQLKHLLERFSQEPTGWAQGGGVFADFTRLVTMHVGKRYAREGAGLMARLRVGLEGMRDVERKTGLEERVALMEMGRVLQREVEELAIRPGGMEVESVDFEMRDGPVEAGFGGFLRYRAAMGVVA